MSMPRLKRKVGPPVEGREFWNRDHEIRELTEYLEERTHVLMVAPRRVGKTSLMRETARRLDDRHHCLFVDVQSCRCPEDAIVEICVQAHRIRDLWTRAAAVFKNVPGLIADAVEEIAVDELRLELRQGLAGDWQAKGRRIFEELAAADRPAVVFVDELPILVNSLLRAKDGRITLRGRTEADQFMSWLRAVALACREDVTLVVAGSIGLGPVLAQADLSATINHFTPFELAPWDHATAIGCIHALAENYGLTFGDGAPAHMVDRLGCGVPHHVQLFFDHVYRDCRRRETRRCAIEDVNRIYESSLLTAKGHAELQHLEERLSKTLDPDILPLALDLLTEAAVTGNLSERAVALLCADHDVSEALARETLTAPGALFDHDGYLSPHAGGWRFVSHLVRDWWERRHGSCYRRADERGAR